MRQLIITILLTLCMAVNAQAVGLQIHNAGTTVASATGISQTELLGQTTGTSGFHSGPAYYFTGYQAVHTGTISSVDIGVQNNGTFQLIIMDAARNTLRSGSSVSVTVPSVGSVNVVNVTFPAVSINAGEYIGYYYSGYTYALSGSGSTGYGSSLPPSSTLNGYQMDIVARIVYSSSSYSVSASPGTNGTLDGTTPSPVNVASGATTSFKFNANSGYYVSGISGCNGTTYSNSNSGVTTYTYTTGAISGACTVSATFTAIPAGGTELIGETGIGNTPWSANYSFRPNFAAAHTGTISSAVFHPLETGNFTLLIYNSSGTLLRTSNAVAVTTTGLQTVSFPPVAINAGEYIGGHHTGTLNCITSAGGSSWYGGPGTPTNATNPYTVRFDLKATLTY